MYLFYDPAAKKFYYAHTAKQLSNEHSILYYLQSNQEEWDKATLWCEPIVLDGEAPNGRYFVAFNWGPDGPVSETEQKFRKPRVVFVFYGSYEQCLMRIRRMFSKVARWSYAVKLEPLYSKARFVSAPCRECNGVKKQTYRYRRLPENGGGNVDREEECHTCLGLGREEYDEKIHDSVSGRRLQEEIRLKKEEEERTTRGLAELMKEFDADVLGLEEAVLPQQPARDEEEDVFEYTYFS